MNIIRDYLVELAKYLPEFLRQDQEMSTILEVESREHRVQVEILKDLINQLFVDSATWGLSNFERNLGLQPEADDDFIQRRNRILLYLQQKRTVNKEFMAKLAARYFSEDAIIEPKEDNPNDMFWIIDHGGRLLYPEDFFEAIDTYIPAHLGFGLRLEWTLDLTAEDRLRVGMATLKTEYQRVGIYLPNEEKHRAGIALLSGAAGVKLIGAAPRNIKETIASGVRLGHLRGGRQEISADMSDLPEHFKDILGDAYLLPRMGTITASKGIRHIPILPPHIGKIIVSIGQGIGQKGRRTYGLAPPENAGITIRAGLQNITSGRQEISADMSDLPGHFKNILGIASIVPRIMTKSVQHGRKTIGTRKPEEAGIKLVSGFFHAAGGFVKIGVDDNDIDERFKSIFGNAVMTLRAGVLATMRARKQISPKLPEDGNAAYKIGLATARTGNKRLSLSIPASPKERLGTGMMIQSSGYILIGVDREDLPIRKRRMPHVGLMQVGTLAVG